MSKEQDGGLEQTGGVTTISFSNNYEYELKVRIRRLLELDWSRMVAEDYLKSFLDVETNVELHFGKRGDQVVLPIPKECFNDTKTFLEKTHKAITENISKEISYCADIVNVIEEYPKTNAIQT